MNNKLAARRLGRAIFEIDNALWSLEAPHKGELEEMRKRMGQMLNAIGYEFAKNDSPAVRLRPKPITLAFAMVMYTNRDEEALTGQTHTVSAGCVVAEVIAKTNRGVRDPRWLCRVEYNGGSVYGWVDRRHLNK